MQHWHCSLVHAGLSKMQIQLSMSIAQMVLSSTDTSSKMQLVNVISLIYCLLLVYRESEPLDLELGSHHGSQQGSAAASSFEGEEMDADEAAAAADFTPMTEEKRVFVNEWIAKLGHDLPDEQAPIEVSYCYQGCTCCGNSARRSSLFVAAECITQKLQAARTCTKRQV